MVDVRKVVDERGVTHALVREIAAGGQGTVWATRKPGLLVKLRNLAHPDDAERLRARLDFVRRVGVADLDVVVPASRLTELDVGYVMEALADMIPLERLRSPTAGADPDAWYRDTGGLRKRLVVLAKLARTLAALHGRGLLYGDVSPANLWVSESAQHDATRLIDMDNVAFLGVEERTFTVGYGAPELELGTAYASSLSDAYSFAIVAFEVLTLIHPLYGDVIEQGAFELEADARAGRYPWVDDPEDDRNRSSLGIDRGLVLTNGLRRLCRDTFGPGRGASVAAIRARPGLATWADELEAAADRTTSCGCGATFYGFSSTCFACNAARRSMIQALVYQVAPGSGEPAGEIDVPTSDRPVTTFVVGLGEARSLLVRHLSANTSSEPIVTVQLEPTQLRLSRVGEGIVEVVDISHAHDRSGGIERLHVEATLSARALPINLAALPDYGLRITIDGFVRLVRFVELPGERR